MSKYSIVSGAAVGYVGHLVMTDDGESIASFKHASDALAYVEHREYVDGVNAMCNAAPEPNVVSHIAADHRAQKGPGTLTPAQIKWAEQHDWHRFSGHGAVVVCEVVPYKGGYKHDLKTFRKWAELRSWAGY